MPHSGVIFAARVRGAVCRNDAQFAGGGVTMPYDSLVELLRLLCALPLRM